MACVLSATGRVGDRALRNVVPVRAAGLKVGCSGVSRFGEDNVGDWQAVAWGSGILSALSILLASSAAQRALSMVAILYRPFYRS